MPWKQNTNTQNQQLTTEPFEQEFWRLRNDFDRLMQSMWRGTGAGDLSHYWPDGGLDETETHYVMEIAAPGFEAGDFDVQTTGNRVVVKAERKTTENGENQRRYSYGSLQRSFVLPSGAQRDGMEANYRNGILELRIPKTPDAQNIKRISVKSS
jgi:HSP20 family protein